MRILWKEGGKVQTYQGQSIEDPMERGKEGGFTHIRVHLLIIQWREGGFANIKVHILGILWRERGGCTYQGPSIEDHMERGKEGSNISGSIS